MSRRRRLTEIAWKTISIGLIIFTGLKTEVKPVTAEGEHIGQRQETGEADLTSTQIEFVGNTVFSDSQLRKVVASMTESTLSLPKLIEIRSKITDYYVQQGYASTSALIPPQDLNDGTIKVQIIEGQLKAIETEGLSHLQRSYLDARLPQVGEVLNVNTLRRSLSELQEDPLIEDLDAQLVEVSPGQNVVNLEIIENSPLDSRFAVTNTFSPSVGTVGGTANIDYHLLGFGDIVNLGYTRTESEGLIRYNAGYSLPVNRNDGKLAFSYVNADAQIIEEPISALDIQADFEVYQLGFRQPIRLNNNSELAVEVKTELIDSQTFADDDIPNAFVAGLENEDARSQISALRLIQEYFNRSDRSSIAIRSQFNLGVDLFDPTVTEVGRDGLFWSWQGQMQWLRRINDLMLVSNLNLQLTPDQLLPVEQITLGGSNSVRGYRQNLSIGDNGAIGNVELRIPLIESTASSIKLNPFVAAGTIWNNSSEEIETDTLVSTGLGLSYELRELIEARIDYAIPLIEADAPSDFSTEQEFTFLLLVKP